MIVDIKMIQDFNNDYDKGLLMQEVADKYYVSLSTVFRYIWHPRKAGKELRVTPSIAKTIIKMREDGYRVKEIMKATNMCESLIYNCLKKNKVKTY